MKIDIEDGNYFPIKNEIIEALIGSTLNGRELQLVLTIIRKTYGFQKKEDTIPLSQISSLMGVDRRNLQRVLRRLVAKNIITRTSHGQNRAPSLAFNKYYKTWADGTLRSTSKAMSTDITHDVTTDITHDVTTDITHDVTRAQTDITDDVTTDITDDALNRQYTQIRSDLSSTVDLEESATALVKLSHDYAGSTASGNPKDLAIAMALIERFGYEKCAESATVLIEQRAKGIRYPLAYLRSVLQRTASEERQNAPAVEKTKVVSVLPIDIHQQIRDNHERGLKQFETTQQSKGKSE